MILDIETDDNNLKKKWNNNKTQQILGKGDNMIYRDHM